MSEQETTDHYAAIFKRAAFDRLMHDDGGPEGEQIKAGIAAVFAALRPGDVLPGGMVVVKSVGKGEAIKACALAIGHPNNTAAGADATDCVTVMRFLQGIAPATPKGGAE